MQNLHETFHLEVCHNYELWTGSTILYQMNAKSPEEWCAVHEAGHACHTYLLGVEPNGLWIQHDPGNQNPQGRVESALLGDKLNEEMLCSGFEAEILLGKQPDHALQTTDIPKLLDGIAFRIGGTSYIHAVENCSDILREAKRIREKVNADLRPHVAAIEALSDAIMQETPCPTSSIIVGIPPFPIFRLAKPEVRILSADAIRAAIGPILGSPGALIQ